MSDEHEMSVIEPKTQRSWTEAPASATVKAKYRTREWMITLRGETGAEVISKIDKVSDWLDKHAEAINVVQNGPELNSVPTPQTPAPVAQANGSGALQINSVKIKIEPKGDGKVSLNFFEAGHQYADIYTTRTVAEAISLLKVTGAWKPEHFAVVAEYPVAMTVNYKLSDKKNSKGNPYKDIINIEAA